MISEREDEEERGPDDPSMVEYERTPDNRAEQVELISAALTTKACTHAQLAKAAGVSTHTISALLSDCLINPRALARMSSAADRFVEAKQARAALNRELLDWARARVKEETRKAFAVRTGLNASNLGNVLTGRKKASSRLLHSLEQARGDGKPIHLECRMQPQQIIEVE